MTFLAVKLVAFLMLVAGVALFVDALRVRHVPLTDAELNARCFSEKR